MAYDAGRKLIVLFGGIGVTILSDTWLWDGRDWAIGPQGPSARFSCAMAYDPANDEIVLYGGRTSRADGTGNRTLSDETWVYR
jgi:hypothetical protein